jgi:hypothetical protein
VADLRKSMLDCFLLFSVVRSPSSTSVLRGEMIKLRLNRRRGIVYRRPSEHRASRPMQRLEGLVPRSSVRAAAHRSRYRACLTDVFSIRLMNLARRHKRRQNNKGRAGSSPVSPGTFFSLFVDSFERCLCLTTTVLGDSTWPLRDSSLLICPRAGLFHRHIEPFSTRFVVIANEGKRPTHPSHDHCVSFLTRVFFRRASCSNRRVSSMPSTGPL